MLAQQVKEKAGKHEILYLLHPLTGKKHYNQQEITNAISAYYNTLYNLKDDHLISQPTPEIISVFQDSVSVPKLKTEQLMVLNAPFSCTKKITRSREGNFVLCPYSIQTRNYMQIL